MLWSRAVAYPQHLFFCFTGRPKPKPGNRYKVYSRTKTSAYLIMNNWGNPQPNYTWYHGSGILPVHNHTHYDTGSKSILNISNVEKGDFGVYWVTMENSFGVYDSEYILSPRGKFHDL